MKRTPRGIRNNNPGNIDYSPNTKWRGQLGIEDGPGARFVKFQNPIYGIRAIVKVLLTYYNKHKLTTIAGMISRWAPPTENSTATYINQVAAACGVAPTARFPIGDAGALAKLVQAIIQHENGTEPYGYELILSVVSATLSER